MLADRRIWIVEDEFLLAIELQHTMEDHGAAVIGPSRSLDEALDALNQMSHYPDAAILDLDLQGEESFPVAERLQAIGIPFLFNTGHGDRRELKERFGGVTVCIKPTSEKEILQCLADLTSADGTPHYQ